MRRNYSSPLNRTALLHCCFRSSSPLPLQPPSRLHLLIASTESSLSKSSVQKLLMVPCFFVSLWLWKQRCSLQNKNKHDEIKPTISLDNKERTCNVNSSRFKNSPKLPSAVFIFNPRMRASKMSQMWFGWVAARGQGRIETSRDQLAASSSRWAGWVQAAVRHLPLFQRCFGLLAGLLVTNW